MADSFSEIDDIFYSDGFKLAASILDNRLDPLSLDMVTSELYETIDSLLSAFVSRVKQEAKALACKKGCYYCCTQPVFINPLEAFFLQAYIFKNFGEKEIEEIRKRTNSKHEITKGMSMKKMLVYKQECPLLKNNICTAYPARPMACRIYLSSDLPSCIGFYEDPEKDSSYARLYEFPLHAGRMLNEGIAKWLELKHLKPHVLTFESALKYILDERDAAQKWIENRAGFEVRELSEEDLKTLKNFELNK